MYCIVNNINKIESSMWQWRSRLTVTQVGTRSHLFSRNTRCLWPLSLRMKDSTILDLVPMGFLQSSTCSCECQMWEWPTCPSSDHTPRKVPQPVLLRLMSRSPTEHHHREQGTSETWMTKQLRLQHHHYLVQLIPNTLWLPFGKNTVPRLISGEMQKSGKVLLLHEDNIEPYLKSGSSFTRSLSLLVSYCAVEHMGVSEA